MTTSGAEKTWLSSVVGKAGEAVRRDGLVTSHAYSLLRAVEVPPPPGSWFTEKVRLVQLRNPWGDDKEWTGAWSDASSKWKNNKHVAGAVGFVAEADGTFWMDYNDWRDLFSDLKIASTADAFAKARADGAFATERAGRGKQSGHFGRL